MPRDLTPEGLREAWGEDLATWYERHVRNDRSGGKPIKGGQASPIATPPIRSFFRSREVAPALGCPVPPQAPVAGFRGSRLPS